MRCATYFYGWRFKTAFPCNASSSLSRFLALVACAPEVPTDSRRHEGKGKRGRQGQLDPPRNCSLECNLYPFTHHFMWSRGGEYLRYCSERYRRYRGLSIFIFILDTISDNQYLSGIFRYLA